MITTALSLIMTVLAVTSILPQAAATTDMNNLRYRMKFNSKERKCSIVTANWEIKTFPSNSYQDCLMKTRYHHRFSANPDLLGQAQRDDPVIEQRMKDAIEYCTSSSQFPDLNEQSIVRYDHRVKEFNSLNQKIFDRIRTSEKYNSKFVYDFNINDVIGFRILTPDNVQSTQLMKCLKSQKVLQITNARTRDGLVHYASGELPTTIGLNGKKQLYEIQIWPFGVGDWMIWQHDLYYKGNPETKPLLKVYKDSVEDAGRCLSHVDFYSQVYPTLEDKSVEGVTQWISDECLNFLNARKIKPSRGKYGTTIDLEPPAILKPADYAPVIEDALRMAAERGMLQ